MARLERLAYDKIAARLAALSDDELAALAQPSSWRTGVGGQSGQIEIEGASLYVKKINLTELELVAENRGSTANLFDLPLFYQYGIGSAGFGAWRELAACLKASEWTLSGAGPYFPLVYHWRVLPRAPPAPLTTEQLARLERAVDYWDHSSAIRARLETIFAAPASLVLFLEYVPETLRAWFDARLSRERAPDAASEAAILRMNEQLDEAATFMNAHGMVHFDLHAFNVLTDGERICVTDFGLALCSDFDLSPGERAFFETHRLYDRCYLAAGIVGGLMPETEPPVLTPALSALADRCAPVAAIMQSFFKALREESKRTPYPAAELEAAFAALSGRAANPPP